MPEGVAAVPALRTTLVKVTAWPTLGLAGTTDTESTTRSGCPAVTSGPATFPLA